MFVCVFETRRNFVQCAPTSAFSYIPGISYMYACVAPQQQPHHQQQQSIRVYIYAHWLHASSSIEHDIWLQQTAAAAAACLRLPLQVVLTLMECSQFNCSLPSFTKYIYLHVCIRWKVNIVYSLFFCATRMLLVYVCTWYVSEIIVIPHFIVCSWVPRTTLCTPIAYDKTPCMYVCVCVARASLKKRKRHTMPPDLKMEILRTGALWTHDKIRRCHS